MQTTITSTDAERIPFWSALIGTSEWPRPWAWASFRHAVSADLFDAIGLADRCGGAAGTIGLLSELTLAYKFKFVWAPFLDQYDPPLIGRVLGRRRGWLIVAILAVMAMLAGSPSAIPAIGSGGRSVSPSRSGSRAQRSISCSTAGASRVCARRRSRRCCPHGPRSAGGSATSRPAPARSTSPTYRLEGRLSVHGGPDAGRDRGDAVRARTALRHGAPQAACRLRRDDLGADPDLLKRLGPMAVAILLLVAGFRMPGYIASAMAVPLFKHQGFTNTDIATVTKVFGFWIALGGTFMAGWLIPRIGMMSSLLSARSRARLRISRSRSCGAWRGWRQGVLDLRAGGRRRGLCLRLRRDRAHHLHVDARVGGACGEPVRPADLPLRLSGQYSGGLSGFVIEHTGFVWFFSGPH